MSDPIRLSHTQCNTLRVSVRTRGGRFAIAVGEAGIARDIGRGFAHLTRGESRLQTHDGIGWLMERTPVPTPEPEPQAAAEATPDPPKASKSKKAKPDESPAPDA